MAGVVPYTVLLVNPHMAHLVGKEILYDRLPHSSVVNVFSNSEDRGGRLSVAELVQSRFTDLTEIDTGIVITEELAPGLRFNTQDQSFSIAVNLE